jgi:iron complex transport system permease protein
MIDAPARRLEPPRKDAPGHREQPGFDHDESVGIRRAAARTVTALHRAAAAVVPAAAARRAARLWLWLALAACAALALATSCGTQGCAPLGLLDALLGGPGGGSDPALAREIVLRLRLPRALAGFAVGGLLALAGALMQVLLRNPLADPYVLGVSGGASFAALLAIWAGAGGTLLLGASWAGAARSIALLFALGRPALRGPSLASASDAPTRLLLTGVMLASGWGALITLVLTLAPDAKLRGMLFWLIGELSGAPAYAPALAALAVASACAIAMARPLNVLLAGDARAFALGIDVRRLRLATSLLGAAATAFSVTTVGSHRVVGLLVPHSLRRVCGNDQRVLLPACALGGGILVVLADTLARTLVAPQQLPVGAIMALVGVPAFLWVLLKSPGVTR